MQDINWLQAGIGFLSGGAFGALIKLFFDERKNRIQRIGQSIEIKSFYNSEDSKLLNSEIILKEGIQEYKFSKLYTGTIQLVNSGLKDYSDFPLGITVPENVNFVQIKSTSSDRHHIAEYTDSPSLKNQIRSFDINLKPFNRKDKYTFDILLTTDSSTIAQTDIQISSPMPVKWVKLISTTDAIIDFATKTGIEIAVHSISKYAKVTR